MLEIASFPTSYYIDAEETLVYAELRVRLETAELHRLEKSTDPAVRAKISLQINELEGARQQLSALSRSFGHRN